MKAEDTRLAEDWKRVGALLNTAQAGWAAALAENTRLEARVTELRARDKAQQVELHTKDNEIVELRDENTRLAGVLRRLAEYAEEMPRDAAEHGVHSEVAAILRTVLGKVSRDARAALVPASDNATIRQPVKP